jgi:exodeoxyribonuclease V alpha subunit
VIVDQDYAMLQRNLLYTGVTRGKKLVILVGQRRQSPSPFANVTWAGPVFEAARMAWKQ